MSQGLSDHTPIILSFPHCPKPKSSFQFCEMWTKDQSSKDIVKQDWKKKDKGILSEGIASFPNYIKASAQEA